MYQTKEKIKAYAFGTGEKVEVTSKKVIPWNKETDDWYTLEEKDKKEAYEYTCARMTLNHHYDKLLKKISNREMSDILMNRLLVFNYVPRMDISNPELVMIYHDNDPDEDRFLPAWVSLDDLEKVKNK